MLRLLGSFLLVIALSACVAPADQNRALARTNEVRQMTVDGRVRDYCLYVPNSYRPGNPVLFHFHGGGGSCQVDYLIGERWERKADAMGFLLVRPSAWNKVWNACSVPPERCRYPIADAEKANVNDLAFFNALYLQIEADFGPGKTYVGGHSMGGMAVYLITCHRSDIIDAAYGVGTTFRPQSCPGGPIPFLHIHGVSDNVVPWPDGGAPGPFPPEYPWPSPLRGIETRAALNGCASEVVRRQENAAATSFTFRNCAADTQYWVVDDCKHGWPGQVPVLLLGLWVSCTGVFNGEDVLWSFLQRH